jgi:hypothetical protein
MMRLSPRRLLPLLVAFGLGCGPLAASAAESWASRLPDALFAPQWYTISIQGTHAGYCRQDLRRLQGLGPAVIESTEMSSIQVSLGSQTLTVTRHEVRRYDADLQPLSITMEANRMGRPSSLVATRQGNTLHVVKRAAGEDIVQDVSLPANYGDELAPLKALLNGELKVGWSRSFAAYDSEQGDLDETVVQAMAREPQPHAGWRLQSTSRRLGLRTVTVVDDHGVMLRQESPDMLAMVVEPATEEEAVRGITPLLLKAQVPAPGECPSPTTLSEMDLRIAVPSGTAASLFPNTRRQTVTGEGRAATLRIRPASAPERIAQLPITDPAVREYLQPSDMAQSADPKVRELAHSIIGQETNAWRAARKLEAWVHRAMTQVSSDPRPVSALEIMKTLTGDCTEHAVLLAALAQAVGLPTRMTVGLAYDQGAFYYHAWNEVFAGEWVEMDATWGQELVDAGHLQIGSAALDSASVAKLNVACARTLGTLEMEVTGTQRRR